MKTGLDCRRYFEWGVSLGTILVIIGAMSGDDLTSLIDRIQRLEDQRSTLNGDIHDLFAAAEAIGFDAKVMRQAIKLRRREHAARESQRDVLDTYNDAVGIRMHESWF